MDANKPERRLAAILAADVVGYSRMMGTDEAGTLLRLKTFEKDVIEPAVASHSGRIVKRMGDGYLVEFQSVVSAVECAVSWQEQANDAITFRIGINLGDLIVQDDDLFGEGVNVAARLEQIAQPGGVCLSADAYRHSRGRTAARFEDLGDRQLKNIAEPVQVYRLLKDGDQPAARPQDDTAPQAAQPGNRNAAVLLAPFRHLGSNGDAESLASGLTETLASALAHFEEFKFIDPGSARAQSERSGSLGAARQLGADYVLEGSVQIAFQKVRIGVQLIDVSTGQRVWSDTLDRSLEDVFELQDDITAFVASTMSDAVGEEQAKAIAGKPDADLTQSEQMVRGIQLLHRVNSEDNLKARAHFECVLRSDPDGLFPRLCRCWTYAIELASGWPPTREDALEFSLREMHDLMRRYPRSAHVHRLLSRLHIFHGDYAQGIAHAERAYELNPYHSDMMIALGIARLWNGELDAAMVQLERAFATNQYVPDAFKSYLSLACFLVGRHEEALRLLDSSESSWSVTRLYRILNLIGSGQHSEARSEAQLLLDDNPEFSIGSARMIASFRREEDRESLNAALRMAGVPD